MSEETLERTIDRAPADDAPVRWGLSLAWSREEPQRVGEVALISGRSVLGRGDQGTHPRLGFVQQRPGYTRSTGPLRSRYVSRDQAWVEAHAHGVRVTQLGRRSLRHNGEDVDEADLRLGDTLEVDGEVLLLLVRRPAELPDLPGDLDLPHHPFGKPDVFGLVGETPAMWELRQAVAFVARRRQHVLVRGPSGTGKELVARGLHGNSGRPGPFVARNAATFPEGLIDAELFGNRRDYPNPGMPDRPGLVGDADGGTLFLDEFAELPEALQAHLLRVLDDGEYQRLGESKLRTADLRLVAATNRPLTALKEDLAARLRLRLELPGLGERIADVPLLVDHLVRGIATRDPEVAARCLVDGRVAIGVRFLDHLLRYPWRTHVRELEGLLWQAIQHGSEGLKSYVPAGPVVSASPEVPSGTWASPDAIPPEVIQACLDKHNGVREKVWRELGLGSRFVLGRLIKKHGLVVRKKH